MGAAKTHRVVARATLICGDPGRFRRVPPGQVVDLPAGEAEDLVRRGHAAWPAKPAASPPAETPPAAIINAGASP